MRIKKGCVASRSSGWAAVRTVSRHVCLSLPLLDLAFFEAYAAEMWVRVLFFGVLRDEMGVPERVLEVAAGGTAGDVVESCRAGAEGGVWGALAVAVNQEYAGRERVLAEGDEVALLPPVSGGR